MRATITICLLVVLGLAVSSRIPVVELDSVLVDAAPASDLNLHQRFRREVCGMQHALTPEQMQEVVDSHNNARRQESSSNMRLMTWDEDLANRAHQWADQCLWKHGMTVSCEGKLIGQNMATKTFFTTEFPLINITDIVEYRWYAEKAFLTNGGAGCMTGEMCGHYKQVVIANANKVGCSFVNCPALQVEGKPSRPYSYNFVCDYSVPVYEGDELNKKGVGCSECNDNCSKGYKCNANLCEECDPSVDPLCSQRSKECIDINPYCIYNTHLCTEPAYEYFMQTNCAASCPDLC